MLDVGVVQAAVSRYNAPSFIGLGREHPQGSNSIEYFIDFQTNIRQPPPSSYLYWISLIVGGYLGRNWQNYNK